MSDMMFVLASQALDITAPTVPSGVSVTAQNGSNALSWTASTDTGGSGVSHYEIWGGNSWSHSNQFLLATITDTLWADFGYSPNVRRYYYVKAVDNAGNISGDSSTVSVINTSPP